MDRGNRPPASRRTLLVAVGTLLLGFAWGFLVHRSKSFPYALIRSAARAAGIGTADTATPAPAHFEVHSRSSAAAALLDLPYADGHIDKRAGLRNVIVHRPGTSPGLDFYSTTSDGRAFLIDNDGRVRWRWTIDRRDFAGAREPMQFGYPRLFPDGSVLVFAQDGPVVKLDRNSRPLWRSGDRVHHDVWAAADGKLYALSHEIRPLPELDPRLPSLLDDIVVMDSTGRHLRNISVYDVLRGSPYRYLLPQTLGLHIPAETKTLDVLHSNHIEVFDGSLASVSPLYREGNILISIKNLNAVAILDGRTLAVSWLWGPTNLTFQHGPTLLGNGNVLVFDNGIARRSAIVEVDPRTGRVVWRYAPGTSFFSPIRGACQRLSNGDTLVTESQSGYAFEVTPDGETVWRFANPSIDRRGFRQAIYRMVRLLSDGPPSREGSSFPRGNLQGAMKIRELRTRREAARAAARPRRFHDATALRGSLPLDLLEENTPGSQGRTKRSRVNRMSPKRKATLAGRVYPG